MHEKVLGMTPALPWLPKSILGIGPAGNRSIVKGTRIDIEIGCRQGLFFQIRLSNSGVNSVVFGDYGRTGGT